MGNAIAAVEELLAGTMPDTAQHSSAGSPETDHPTARRRAAAARYEIADSTADVAAMGQRCPWPTSEPQPQASPGRTTSGVPARAQANNTTVWRNPLAVIPANGAIWGALLPSPGSPTPPIMMVPCVQQSSGDPKSSELMRHASLTIITTTTPPGLPAPAAVAP
jgi:hypothetical protein